MTCWLCSSKELEVVKHSSLTKKDLSSKLFAITDSAYGKTLEIYRCSSCGFMQCSSVDEVLGYYEMLQDEQYEDTRKPRSLQMKKILEIIKKHKDGGKLLDVGAGSGVLVEQALTMDYDAEGIEPSEWLTKKAHDRKLPVHEGTLNNLKTKELYDIVTIIDVIEHVTSPLNLLTSVYNLVASDGIIVIVTPDVGSLVAKLLSWKWWHYRVAHVGYFNKNTLNYAFDKTGFKLIKMFSPSWYFTGDYVTERINKYLPGFMCITLPAYFRNKIIPINARDSILGIYTPKTIQE